ncbi:S-adenosyl-L-methionine-dependent methyltransferase [Phycomyces nitens]|nr:S-adenosyl-L-methionine-dependent methyltransferase [Phycomyces nitens]
MTDPVRCIEFFCGIGGLHYALNIAKIRAHVVEAFDVNEIANKVYLHNFQKNPSKKTIDRLTAKDIEKLDASCWLVSPPCQPYTRGGKMQDIEDPRAKALVHLIDMLPKLSTPPKYIFVENVKNFETSQSRERLVRQLDTMDYEINECLLTPEQLGVPNHRMRYYLTARRRSNPATKEVSDYMETSVIHTSWPFSGSNEMQNDVPELGSFFETLSRGEEKYLVPAKYILKLHGFRLDIVRSTDKITSCVTKAYGSHHIMTSGSLVQTKQMDITEYDWNDPPSLVALGLRFLTPTEISRLHAFPGPGYQLQVTNLPYSKKEPRPFSPPTCMPHLDFPDSVTLNQRYKLLGNSLNCWVVAELLRCVLFEEDVIMS